MFVRQYRLRECLLRANLTLPLSWFGLHLKTHSQLHRRASNLFCDKLAAYALDKLAYGDGRSIPLDQERGAGQPTPIRAYPDWLPVQINFAWNDCPWRLGVDDRGNEVRRPDR